jgi:hypothetical protein
MKKVRLNFDKADLDNYVFSGSTTVNLTNRRAALIFFVLPLLLDRSAWETMTDAEWNDLENLIARTMNVISEAIQ